MTWSNLVLVVKQSPSSTRKPKLPKKSPWEWNAPHANAEECFKSSVARPSFSLIPLRKKTLKKEIDFISDSNLNNYIVKQNH